MKTISLLKAGAAGACLAISLPSFAQTAASPAAPSVDDGAEQQAGIQDIVVTAQRREQNLQDVPIAISAFSAERLDQAGITTSYDLSFIAPGLSFGRTLGFASPFLRGVGTTNVTGGDEPSVATYVDGVYQGSMLSAALPFNNVERIEVLKGPQGTLFGRNATGGLVNIVTKAPSDRFEASGSLSYESFKTIDANAYVTGPLGDNAQIAISGRLREQDKGLVTNLVTGNRIGKEDVRAVRVKLAIQPTDTISIDLSGDYLKSATTTASTRAAYPGTVPLAVLGGGLYSEGPRTVYNSMDPIYDVETWGLTAKIKAELGGVDFVSLSGFRHTDVVNALEADGTSLDNRTFVVHPTLGVQQLPTLSFSATQEDPYFLTQEFQLLSNGNGPFTWIIGAFGQRSRADYKPLALSFNIAGSPFATLTSQVKTTALAVFGQADYDITDALTLTAGLRYSYERKTFEGSGTGAFAALSPQSKKSWEAVTWRLAANYQLNDAIMIYGVSSRGFKSGVYNSNSLSDIGPVNPERLDAFEVGIKSDPAPWLRINASAFTYNYKNLQLLQLVSAGTSSLRNAARARIDGLEAEIEIVPANGFNIRGGLSVIDSRYTDYPAAAIFVPAPPAGNATTSIDAKGLQLIRTPDLTFNLGASYEAEIAGFGTLSFSGDFFHSASFPWEVSGRVRQPAYEVVNASIGWRTPDDRWGLSLFARNLTDQIYGTYFSSGGRGDLGAYAQPRTFGVKLDIDWR